MKNNLDFHADSNEDSVLKKLIQDYKIEKIANLTKLDELSEEISLLVKDQVNDTSSIIYGKLDSIEKRFSQSDLTPVSKDELISKYLSSEFQEMKESTIKNIKNEVNTKFKLESLKSKKLSTLLFIGLSISIAALVVSIFTLIQ